MGSQRLGRKANQSSLYNTNTKNEWSFISIPQCTFLTSVRTLLTLLAPSKFLQELEDKQFYRTDVSLNSVCVKYL